MTRREERDTMVQSGPGTAVSPDTNSANAAAGSETGGPAATATNDAPATNAAIAHTLPTVGTSGPTAESDQAAGADPSGAPDVSELPPLTSIPGPANPSPDGERVALIRPDADGPVLTIMMLADGAESRVDLPFTPRPATALDGDTSFDDGAVWSPDGTHLALSGAHPDTGHDAIWLVDVESGNARLLVDHAAADRGAVWSPDSAWMAFTTTVNGRDRIAYAAVAPEPGMVSCAIVLTDGAQDDRDPSWLKSGTELVFRRRLADPTTDDLYAVDVATGELRQITGRPGRVGLGAQPATRWTPRGSPEKIQVAYAGTEKDWALIAISNAENGTGWTLAGEAGDKRDPRWSPDGKKIAYVRTLGLDVRICVKGTASATTEVLDPGSGHAAHPRWLPDGRVLYWYVDSVRAPVLIVQEPKAAAARTIIGHGTAAAVDAVTTPVAPTSDDDEAPVEVPETSNDDTAAEAATEVDAKATPEAKAALPGAIVGMVSPEPIEIVDADEHKLPGLLYRPAGDTRHDMTVISLLDGPPGRQDYAPNVTAQRLAQDGLSVFAANLHGTPGLGRTVRDALSELADIEVEAGDLATIAATLRAHDAAVPQRIALAGRGFGGTLALVAAGARPGTFQAVAAIDPITDWDVAFDHASSVERAWLQQTYGMPAIERGRYALRTPATFAGIIDAPILLIGTADAPAGRAAQLDALAATLQDLGVPFERQEAPSGSSDSDLAGLVAAFLGRHER